MNYEPSGQGLSLVIHDDKIVRPGASVLKKQEHGLEGVASMFVTARKQTGDNPY